MKNERKSNNSSIVWQRKKKRERKQSIQLLLPKESILTKRTTARCAPTRRSSQQVVQRRRRRKWWLTNQTFRRQNTNPKEERSRPSRSQRVFLSLSLFVFVFFSTTTVNSWIPSKDERGMMSSTLTACKKALKDLIDHRYSSPFREAREGHFEKIKRPMDLCTVQVCCDPLLFVMNGLFFLGLWLCGWHKRITCRKALMPT